MDLPTLAVTPLSVILAFARMTESGVLGIGQNKKGR